jgi:hypothetical protein
VSLSGTATDLTRDERIRSLYLGGAEPAARTAIDAPAGVRVCSSRLGRWVG